MKTNILHSSTPSFQPPAPRPSSFAHQRPQRFKCAPWVLALLLLGALTGAVQAQFTFITNQGAITITGYTGPGGNVAIPDTINGLPVTTIGDEAFANDTSLTNVTIPNSVTTIGDWAFDFCTSLTNAAMGKGSNLFRLPRDVAGYVLHVTAANILLLASLEKRLK